VNLGQIEIVGTHQIFAAPNPFLTCDVKSVESNSRELHSCVFGGVCDFCCTEVVELHLLELWFFRPVCHFTLSLWFALSAWAIRSWTRQEANQPGGKVAKKPDTIFLVGDG